MARDPPRVIIKIRKREKKVIPIQHSLPVIEKKRKAKEGGGEEKVVTVPEIVQVLSFLFEAGAAAFTVTVVVASVNNPLISSRISCTSSFMVGFLYDTE